MKKAFRSPGGAGTAECGVSACVMAVLLLVLAAGNASAGWDEFGLAPKEVTAAPDTILEPFFAFVIGMAETDSLGSWRGSDVSAFALHRGRESRLPMERLATIERRRPEPGSGGRYPGAIVRAEWVITFDSALDFPLPYSIVGYHPGSLRVSSALRLVELAPQDMTLAWRTKREIVRHPVSTVRVFTCESGYMLLDADAVVDHLLGDLLDDAWTVGFVAARDGDQLLGLSIMVGRDLRSIYGEFDFARDRIEPNGRPLASALAGVTRRWLDPELELFPDPWVEK
jgi:hypothetical protein